MSYNKMLVFWGGLKKLLQPFNSSQKFIVVGNHSIKLKKQDNDDAKKTQKKNIIFLMQQPAKLNSEQHLKLFIELAKRVAKEFPNIIVTISQPPRYIINNIEQKKLRKFLI